MKHENKNPNEVVTVELDPDTGEQWATVVVFDDDGEFVSVSID